MTCQLDTKTTEALALELHKAEQSGEQLEQISKRHPEMTIDDSYAIQRAWVQIKLSEGQKVKGHKIGLTSRAMQVVSKIEEPDYGCLLDSMFFRDGGNIPTARFIQPRVEVELAFVLGRRLSGPDVSIFDVLAATDYVVPALEIIDARVERLDRVTNEPRKVLDTIADNAANAGIVMGGRPVKPDAVDLRWCGALLYQNGVIEESGLAAAVLNHPANGIAWLAGKLALHDEALEAGEVVLAGSFTRPVSIALGDVFHADYGELGSITFEMV